MKLFRLTAIALIIVLLGCTAAADEMKDYLIGNIIDELWWGKYPHDMMEIYVTDKGSLNGEALCTLSEWQEAAQEAVRRYNEGEQMIPLSPDLKGYLDGSFFYSEEYLTRLAEIGLDFISSERIEELTGMIWLDMSKDDLPPVTLERKAYYMSLGYAETEWEEACAKAIFRYKGIAYGYGFNGFSGWEDFWESDPTTLRGQFLTAIAAPTAEPAPTNPPENAPERNYIFPILCIAAAIAATAAASLIILIKTRRNKFRSFKRGYHRPK